MELFRCAQPLAVGYYLSSDDAPGAAAGAVSFADATDAELPHAGKDRHRIGSLVKLPNI